MKTNSSSTGEARPVHRPSERLQDGVTHYVDTLPPDATSLGRVVGLTCDEVFFAGSEKVDGTRSPSLSYGLSYARASKGRGTLTARIARVWRPRGIGRLVRGVSCERPTVLPRAPTIATIVTVLACTLGCASPRATPSPNVRPHGDGLRVSPRDRLEAALEAIARESSGTVAATVVHVERGEKVSLHGGVRLPMMSVFKLPLAVVALAAVDEGRLSLSSPVPLDAHELRRWVSPIAEAWDRGERAPTLARLVETAVERSDNTSGDKLVTLLGGGPRITAALRALGYPGIDVAEEEIAIATRLACPDTPPKPGIAASEHLAACSALPPLAKRALAAAEREASAPPNGATTDALAVLLVDLARGRLLSEPTRSWLLAAMERSTTGPGRLRAGLPAGARLAHKTGTGETVAGLNVATNDVGIVTLPDGSHLVVAVMTSKVPGDDATRDRVIARIAHEAAAAFAVAPQSAPRPAQLPP